MGKKNKNWWGGNSSSSGSESGSWKSSFFDWDNWTSGKGYTYTPPIKKQIVKPYLHWYDAGKLIRGIHGDTEFTNHVADNILSAIFGNQPSANASLREKSKDLYQELVPDHLIEDIYSIYYNKSSTIEFAELKDSNEVKFKILESINNSLLKIVSNNNSIASFMYTKEISHFLFQELLSQLTPDEQQDLKNSMKDCNKGEAKNKNKKDQNEDTDNDEEGDSSEKQGSGKGKGKRSSGKAGGSGSEDRDSSETEEEDISSDKGEGDDSEDEDNSRTNREGNSSDDEENDVDNQGGDNGNLSQDNNKSRSKKGGNPVPPGKSNHRENPLGGHNVEEDTSGVREWKEKNSNSQKQQTREEALANKIESIFNKPDVKQRFDNAIMKADMLMSDLEKAGINLSEDGLSQIAEIANLNQVRKDIHALTMNKKAIVEAIKQILDNSKNYFSRKYKLKEIDLLEADEIEDIYGMEYVHPVFQGLMIDRLSTEERKYMGRIDLYIDISGSMSSNCGIPGVSNLLFAKSIALAMLNMDLLNNLYTFDTRVKKIEPTELNILMIGFGGGTSIETVVQHVVNIGKNNAICLTDGEDSVQTYDERMFFMGTIGVLFSYFSHPGYGKLDENGYTAGMKYIKNGQCINFDGDKSIQINEKYLKSQGKWYGS